MNFKEPYPREESVRAQILISILIGLFIAVFLDIFQPFGLSLWNIDYKIIKISGFGLVTIFVMMLRYFVYPRIFSSFFDLRNWTVGKEILDLLLTVLTIAVLNYVYLVWIAPYNAYRPNFIQMVVETLVVGVFPVTFLVLGNYIYQLKKFSSLASELPIKDQGIGLKKSIPLVLFSENESEKLALEADELIYIEAKGNYTEINFFETDKNQKKLIRSTLSRMEEQIRSQSGGIPHIIKCHRSFIVNLSQVGQVKGNAQGYRFHIRNTPLEVPVGRKFKECIQIWKGIE
jgi:hypothetical protein